MYISMFVLRLKHMLRFLEKSITEYPIMNDIFCYKKKFQWIWYVTLIGNASFGTVCAGDSKFSFPWIIQTFGLHCYDFFKVLESFIKAEPILTKEIVKVTIIILSTPSCFDILSTYIILFLNIWNFICSTYKIWRREF